MCPVPPLGGPIPQQSAVDLAVDAFIGASDFDDVEKDRVSRGQYLAILGGMGVIGGALLPWASLGGSPYGPGLTGLQFGGLGVVCIVLAALAVISIGLRHPAWSVPMGLAIVVATSTVLIAFEPAFQWALQWAQGGLECMPPCSPIRGFGLYLTFFGGVVISGGGGSDLRNARRAVTPGGPA